ncbi:MAG: hypothetical protein Q7T71_05560 [Herbiconiux sp.]|nr:hypothetical protein [Herbiconiux sp.]
MSTEDRPDGEQPENTPEATPPLPAMPAWEPPAVPAEQGEPAAPAATTEPPRRVYSLSEPDEVVAEEVVTDDEVDGVETTAARPAFGGPYVVTETGAPVSEQAVSAYDREAQGGPYVTSSEPPVENAVAGPEPTTATPYPAAAFAPAPAPVAQQYPGYQPEPTAAQPLSPIQAPVPPRPKGNRGAGTLIALLGTVLFGVVYAAVSFVIIAASLGADTLTAFTTFLASAAFVVPVVVFALALILIVLIVNRAGWWAYVLGGFLVAVLVYFAGIAGALVHVQAWNWQPQEQYEFVRSLVMDPLVLAGAIVAREASVWTGAWIAARGRKVRARNDAALEEFKKQRAENEASGSW